MKKNATDDRNESFLGRRARERTLDRERGEPERGLFTGRGLRSKKGRYLPHSEDAGEENYSDGETDDAEEGDEYEDRSGSSRPRTGGRRTVLHSIRLIPKYLRLLVGLMGDSRVSRLDRGLVIAAAAYILSPFDFIPDFIPFLGQADDIFFVVIALQHLIDHTGRRILMDHWKGDPDELSDVKLSGVVSAAAYFLPPAIRRRLKKRAGR